MDPKMMQQMQGQQQMPEGQMDQGEGGEDEARDPEWDKAEIALKRVMYDGGMLKELVSRVLKSDNLSQSIAEGCLQTMRTLDERTGGNIPEDYLMPLATMMVADVADGVEAAGREVPSRDLAIAVQMMIFDQLVEFGSDAQTVKAQLDKVNLDQLAAAMDEARAADDNGEGKVGGVQDEAEPQEEAVEPPDDENQPLIQQR